MRLIILTIRLNRHFFLGIVGRVLKSEFNAINFSMFVKYFYWPKRVSLIAAHSFVSNETLK